MHSCGLSKEHGSQEDGMFPNVNLESVRCPSADGLDDVQWNTSLSESCGATSIQGVTPNGFWEMFV